MSFLYLKDLIRRLEAHTDLRPELKQLENKVSIVSLTQTYNQCLEKREQLLSNTQVEFLFLYLD